MLRNFSSLLWIVLALPVNGYAQNSEREYHIEKQKLTCLYKRVDDLLERRADPVMVVLERECDDSQVEAGDRVRGGITLPFLVLGAVSSTNGEGGVTSKDVLMLTKEQLQCFKLRFNKLLKDNKSDPVLVDFGKICQSQ